MGCLCHGLLVILLELMMLLIQAVCHFSCAATEGLLLHLNFIVIDIVNITGLDAHLLEEPPIILPLLLLQLLFDGHLLQLFGLDVFEHLGTLLDFLHLHLRAFVHVLFDLLDTLIVSHIELAGGIEMHDCIPMSHARNSPRR